jgi:hypothetical protein
MARTFGDTPEQKQRKERDYRRKRLIELIHADYQSFVAQTKVDHPSADETLDRMIDSLNEYRTLRKHLDVS